MSAEFLVTRFDFDQPTFILCCLSASITTAVFILSMVDLGVGSFYLGPIVSALTFVFHITYCILRHRHHYRARGALKRLETLPPGYTIASIACVSSLSILWTGPLAMTIWTADASLRHVLHQSNIKVLFAQITLCAVNLLLLVFMASLLVFGRRDFLRSHPIRNRLNANSNDKELP